jgi:hypothetical protein
MFRVGRRLAALCFVFTVQYLHAADVESTLERLSKIRLDRMQVFSVRDITLDRDIFSITLNRGTLAFTEPVDGRVTGAVFIGSGDILAIPADAIEKRQLYRYTKSALLSEHFETAVFRFTDNSYDDILKEYRNHASETPEPADVEQILRWDSEIQRRSAFLNDRILTDLFATRTRPLFLAQIEGSRLGWFDAIYDDRRTEEIFLQQNAGGTPVVWVSLNKRAESRDFASVAHEDKSPVEITSVNEGGTQLRIRIKDEGERVFELPVSATNVKRVTLDDGNVLPFLLTRNRLVVVFPTASRSGDAATLHIEFGPEGGAIRTNRAVNTPGTLIPATYHDLWIVEGLAMYASAMSNADVLAAARQSVVAQSPDGEPYESRGPIWLGERMLQPDGSPAALAAFRAKSVWVVHMLRKAMQSDQSDGTFARVLDEVVAEFQNKPVSTFDLKKIAEKHAGKTLDWFFDDWVFGSGIPAYSLTFKIETAPNGFAITGNISQAGVPDTFESPVPLFADDKFLGNVDVSNAGGEFRFVTRTRPQQVLLDPQNTILKRD